jgi:outer membrane receptor protein involved in Fe transport
MKLLRGLLVFLLLSGIASAQTSGKIMGVVMDEDGNPLPGANVVVEGTEYGAAANQEGYYVILNVPPGIYSVTASYVGYATLTQSGVRVEIDLTAEVDFSLKPQAFQGETVTVVAQMPVVKKDVSGSQLNMSFEEMEVLPATSVSEVLGLKAGITSDLSIRGSGSDQVLFMVDGISQRDSRNNSPIQAVPLSAVQEVSVQTGGLSAEYSNVRSGVVNVMAKEGPKDHYTATASYKISPPDYKHFGVSPYSEESYWLRPYLDDEVAWCGVANSDWDKWTKLQYEGNQFEGWNAVSRRTMAEDNPENQLTSAAAQRIFKWVRRKDGFIKEPDYNIDMGFGGPVPFVSEALGNLRFYASFYQNRNMYLIPLSTPDLTTTSGMLKLTSDISRKTKLSITSNFSKIKGTSSGGTNYFNKPYSIANALDRTGFTLPWRVFTYEYFSQMETASNSLAAKVTHMIDAASFLDLTVSRIQRDYTKGYGQRRDTVNVYEIFPGYYLDEAPVGYSFEYENAICGMATGGPFATARDSSQIVTYNVKASYRTQLNQHNQVKVGFNFTFDDLYIFLRGVNPLPDGNYRTEFSRSPYRLSAFAEDKLEFEGLVINLGLVADYIQPNGDWYDPQAVFDGHFFGSFPEDWVDIDNVPDSLKKRADSQLTVSPRVGISHPITETSKLFFNYGHYYQLPMAEDMFQIDYQKWTNQVNYFGNPSLELARTVSYELGFEQSFMNTYLIHISAYYKDVKDQQDYTRYINSQGNVNYYALTNNSFEDIRGFEIELTKRTGRWVAGNINYEYRVNSSGFFGYKYYYENPSEQRNYEKENPQESKPLPQPRAKSYIDFHTPYDFHPLLANWHLTALSSWTAGRWFTWNPRLIENTRGAVIQNNVRWKDTWQFDLKLSKTFNLSNSIRVKFFADINNALNFKQFSGVSFYDKYDYEYYMYSLQLPAEQGDDLEYGNIPGDDKPGDIRAMGADFVPMRNLDYTSDLQEDVIYYRPSDEAYLEYDGNQLVEADDDFIQQVLDDKAYIDMPNLTSIIALNPRDFFFGVNVSFDLGK